jgi:hypothetical protein
MINPNRHHSSIMSIGYSLSGLIDTVAQFMRISYNLYKVIRLNTLIYIII